MSDLDNLGWIQREEVYFDFDIQDDNHACLHSHTSANQLICRCNSCRRSHIFVVKDSKIVFICAFIHVRN